MVDRKANIDLLRVISAAAIVILHSVTAPLGNASSPIPLLTEQILTVIHSLTLWAVPAFFIITGYCLLLKPECSYKYCFLHIRKFVIVLFTVGLFYALLEEVYSTGMVNGLVVLVAVKNVIAGNIWDHMWFVYAIIGIYLVMPVVHGFIKRERKDSFILTAILFAFNILFPVFQKWIPIGVELPFGGYLFYVCFGGLIAKYGIRKREMIVIVIAGLISAAYLGVHYNGKIAESIDLLAVCIMSLAVFLIFEHMKIKPSRLLLALAKCSWGIYLLHPLIINVALKVLKMVFVSYMPYVKIPLLAICTFILSFAITYLLRKIPFVSELF